MKNLLIISIVVLSLVACKGTGARQQGVESTAEIATKTTAQGAQAAQKQLLALSDSLLMNRGSDTIDMGRVFSGETVSRTLTLANHGEKPFVITAIEKNCGCVDVEYPNAPLKPGERADISVSFDSRGLKGWVYKTVGVRTSLDAKPYTLVVTANVE